MASKSVSVGLVLIVLFGLTSVIGDRSIGVSKECFDIDDNLQFIDNDGDGVANYLDPSCINYPYTDGNGETDTPPFEQNTGEKYLNGNSWDFWENWFIENQFSLISYCFEPNPYDPVYQPEANQAFIDFQNGPECPP